jgi:hypothetical protein
MPLSSASLASDIIRDLRRVLTVRNIGYPPGLGRYERLLTVIRQDEVGASHVYDTGHLLDVDHQDYIQVPKGYALIAEARNLQTSMGLFMPHPEVSFVCRVHQPGEGWGVYVHYAQEQSNTILIHSFFHTPKLLPKVAWLWMGASYIPRNAQGGAPNEIACSKLVYNETNGEDVKERTQTLISNPLIATMLLLQKGDTVIVEPAPWWPANEPAKPKAFETANPSVSIVRVNTPRIIVRPPRDDNGSGTTLRPHTVRSHLRRRGNRIIQVRSFTKPRNTTPSAVPKVVKIDTPL